MCATPDRTNPTVLGELKIPGFSEYLHPLTETELIGVGRDGDDAGILGGVKISLFDVSDLAAPVEAFTVAVGERGSMTLVADDHKAFRALDANTITLPITETVVEPHPEWGKRGGSQRRALLILVVLLLVGEMGGSLLVDLLAWLVG